jgi:hypothetical protein
MAIVTKPMIANLTLDIEKDIANAEITVDFDINWSAFDQATDLAYNELWQIVGVDGAATATLYVGPSLANGVSSGGAATTHRTKTVTIPWTDLDEDINDDEIAAVVTLTPLLPTAKSAQSPTVTVVSP